MRPDYYVSFRSREAIASIARDWRIAGNVDHREYFDIVDFIENCLSKRYLKKGNLKIEFFNATSSEAPASVSYNPLLLRVDQETWDLAKLGDPRSRFILAHEVGHIVLHDHHAKSFSKNPELRLRFPMDENKSEWQADNFADPFLASDQIILQIGEENEIAITCGIPLENVIHRLQRLQETKRKRFYTGDFCKICFNLSLSIEGGVLCCERCGPINGSH